MILGQLRMGARQAKNAPLACKRWIAGRIQWKGIDDTEFENGLESGFESNQRSMKQSISGA